MYKKTDAAYMHHVEERNRRWHEEAEAHWVRDMLVIGLAIVIGYILLVGVGSGLAFAKEPKYYEDLPVIDNVMDATRGMSDVEQHEKQKRHQAAVTQFFQEIAIWEAEQAAAEAEAYAEAMAEEQYYTDYAYSDDYGYDSSDYSGDGHWFKSVGVVRENGWRYTWYSSNENTGAPAYGGDGTADADGIFRDADGYVMVAANRGDLSGGDTVDTPFGPGKVYDTGCSSGTIDVYTNW